MRTNVFDNLSNGLFMNYIIKVGGSGGKPKDNTKQQRVVGVWPKITMTKQGATI